MGGGGQEMKEVRLQRDRGREADTPGGEEEGNRREEQERARRREGERKAGVGTGKCCSLEDHSQ